VIDHGSYLLKAGFAHQNAPSALVPALVGRPHHPGPLVKVNPHSQTHSHPLFHFLVLFFLLISESNIHSSLYSLFVVEMTST
jgi:actin-related protein